MRTLLISLLLVSRAAFAAPGSLENYLESASDALGIRIAFSAPDVKKGEGPKSVDFRALSPDAAMSKLQSDLLVRGLTLVHDPELDLYRLLPVRNARDEAIPLITEESKLPKDDTLVTFPFYLKYAPPDPIARSLRSFSPASSRFVLPEGFNGVLVTDSARAMPKYAAIIARLDTPQAAEEFRQLLKERETETDCPADYEPGFATRAGNSAVQIALFGLVGLALGFLIRGYVIRRIEGGL